MNPPLPGSPMHEKTRNAGSPRITIRRIAEVAEVSPMTVSRALRNHPRQSAATRERIQKIARELGYRPHPYVSALMSDLSRLRRNPDVVNLAVLHFDSEEKVRTHSYYKGIVRRANALGYIPEPFAYPPSPAGLARLRKVLIARGIRGMILMPANDGFTSLDFDFHGFAVVAMGLSIVAPTLPKAAHDICGTTSTALKTLTESGHRRIGMISTPHVNELSAYLYVAGLKAFRRATHPRFHLVDLELRHSIDSRRGRDIMTRWIAREKLDAVVSPIFGCRLCHILQEEGVEIPQRLGYLHLTEYPGPDVSYFDHESGIIAEMAVNAVVGMISRNEYHPEVHPYTISVAAKLQEGASLPLLPAMAASFPASA